MMDEFTWFPDIGSDSETEPTVNVVQFGDGYELRVPEGINSEKTTWNLTFSRVASEANEIIAFLRKQGGYKAFKWTTPEKEPVVCVCRSWKRTRNEGYIEITCAFERVYEN